MTIIAQKASGSKWWIHKAPKQVLLDVATYAILRCKPRKNQAPMLLSLSCPATTLALVNEDKGVQRRRLAKGCHILAVKSGKAPYALAAQTAEETVKLFEQLVQLQKKTATPTSSRTSSSRSDATASMDGSLTSSEASIMSSLSSSSVASSPIASTPASPLPINAPASMVGQFVTVPLEVAHAKRRLPFPCDAARASAAPDASSCVSAGTPAFLLFLSIFLVGMTFNGAAKALEAACGMMFHLVFGRDDVLVTIVTLLTMVAAHAGCFGLHHMARTSSSRWVMWAQTLLALGGFTAACGAIATFDGGLGVKGALIPLVLVGSIKLGSFNFISAAYRELAAAGTLEEELNALSTDVGFSVGDITLSSLLYFLAAPVLVYQAAYPRTCTNWARVGILMAELAVIGAVCSALSLGFLLPHLEASVPELQAIDLRPASISLDFRVHCGIAVLNTITWVVGVGYGVFHVVLNLLAELSGFADRHFYGKWWEAADFGAFWRAWNLPVHQLCRLHVMPVAKAVGLPIQASYILVFLLSALLHEIPLALMFRTWRTYGAVWCWFGPAFWAMMVQMPLASITSGLIPKTKAGQMVGNMVFWIIFCGAIQPLVMEAYLRDLVLA